ncbi:hypothetical protein EJ110_NYTH24581 [Nymphaea thermarum]|nr:hypothetical protein EJ110_NYTH24581 [Nymphaea thermarum]
MNVARIRWQEASVLFEVKLLNSDSFPSPAYLLKSLILKSEVNNVLEPRCGLRPPVVSERRNKQNPSGKFSFSKPSIITTTIATTRLMALAVCLPSTQSLSDLATSSKPPRIRTKAPSAARQLSSSTISCSSNQDARFAAELRAQTMKHKVSGLQITEAMMKSRILLFDALCEHSGLRAEEMSKKWAGLSESEKTDCLKGFIAEWGARFLPLSLKSVRGMVEEHVCEGNHPRRSSPSLSVSVMQRLKDFLNEMPLSCFEEKKLSTICDSP